MGSRTDDAGRFGRLALLGEWQEVGGETEPTPIRLKQGVFGQAILPLPGKSRLVAVIDYRDLPLVRHASWHVVGSAAPYVGAIIRRRRVMLHRLIMGLTHDDPRQIDHADRDRLNNTRRNLRICDGTRNMANARNVKHGGKSQSRYRGVHYDRGGWKATISAGRRTGTKMDYLGKFKTEEEAARAWDKAARERYGDFATLNFPEEETT